MAGNGRMANKIPKAATTATLALRILWEEGFFEAWRKSKAIEDQLAKRGNHFSAPELGMALKRAKELTRRGKRGEYEYIQKYPTTAIDASDGKKRGK
jgi:hypothetical protein